MRKLRQIANMGKWYYAVANGRNTGIYENWSDCQQQVNGYSGAKYKKFSSVEAAQDFLDSSPGPVSGYSGGHSSRYSSSSSDSYCDNCPAPSSTPRRAILIDYPRENMDFMRDRHGRVDVYIDGSCIGNGRRGASAGYGVWFGDNHALNTSKPVPGRQTNNRAEILAAIEAINLAKSAGITRLNLITDSKFLIQSYYDWMPTWKHNGWMTSKNQPVLHKEEFLDLERAMSDIDAILEHVPAHTGIHGNEMADRLARNACS